MAAWTVYIINQPLFVVCMQRLSVKKYFELEEDRLKDFLKREELWEKQKKEADELKKRTVSCGFWL